MHAQYLDRYSFLDSPVHRLPPSLKLAAATAAVAAMAWIPYRHGAWLAAAAAILAALTLLSRVPVWFLLKRLLLLEPLVAGVAILALFQPGGGKLFLLLMARSTLCLWTMLLLSNTTPFTDLLELLRRWRVPGLLVTTLALMYRYLFVLMDESQRMRRARQSRTLTAGRLAQWRAGASVISQLFIRAGERAGRVYAAMCARGWT